MFTKTSNYFFQKYGDTYLNLPNEYKNFISNDFTIQKHDIDYLYYTNDEIFIHINEGIALLCVSFKNKSDQFEQFVIHHTIRLKKNCYFNFISISNESNITIKMPNNTSIRKAELNGNEIIKNQIKPSVSINEILVYYYQVKSSNYVFSGETHQYWELTYIDNGHLITEVDGKEYQLKQHDIMLYAPGQFHTQKMDGVEACSYLTVIFKMDFNNPNLLRNQVFHSSRKIINTLQNFIHSCDKEGPYYNDLCICYLNQIIVQLLQLNNTKSAKIANSPIQQKFEDQFLNEIVMFINYNYSQPLTVDQLCQKFSISRSSLQQLFNKNLGITPKQYITEVKLKKAKILIKENKYTISEISEKLGFTSIHYFSRKFKKEFNISPSDYAKSIYKI